MFVCSYRERGSWWDHLLSSTSGWCASVKKSAQVAGISDSVLAEIFKLKWGAGVSLKILRRLVGSHSLGYVRRGVKFSPSFNVSLERVCCMAMAVYGSDLPKLSMATSCL